jgi:hypothetical protein
MADARKKILTDWFILVDNPFAPEQDARGFNFGVKNARLTRPLNVFEIGELIDYFVQVGSYEKAVEEITNYLAEIEYPYGAAYPPAFYVYGESGAGRSSMAYFIAHLIKDKWNPGSHLSIKAVKVDGDNLANHLFAVMTSVKKHAQNNNCPEGVEVVEEFEKKIKPEDPSEKLLRDMFTDLAPYVGGLPPLILIFENLEYKHHDEWFKELYAIFRDLNFVLIFLGQDNLLADIFEGLGEDISGRVIHLGNLDQGTAVQFLEKRMGSFRLDGYPANADKLFPFYEKTLDIVFENPRDLNLRLIITLFQRALRMKLEELMSSYAGPQGGVEPRFEREQLLISKRLIEKSLRELVRKK